MTKEHELILNELEKKYNISKKEVLEIINSPFIFIREEIKKIDFTVIKNEKELNELKTNFNIPRIGKLYANYFNIKKVNDVRTNKGQSKKGEE